MTKLYDQLKEDHRNLVKVLDVLKRQIALYNTREEAGTEKPDIALILDVMDYIQHYPDRFHHPLEEACFDYLDEHKRGDAVARDAIREEHEALEHSASKVRTLLNAINLGEAVPLDKLQQTLDQFHSLQINHLKREEKTVFKDISALDDAASEIILDRVEHRHDPLFADVANQQFTDLIRQLKQQ